MAKTLLEYRQDEVNRRAEAQYKKNALLNYIKEPDDTTVKEEAKASSEGGRLAWDYILNVLNAPFYGPIGMELALTKPLWEKAYEKHVPQGTRDSIEKVTDTFTHVLDSVKEGVNKSVEGAIDFTALNNPITWIGGAVSDDFKDGVKDFVAEDWVGDFYNKGYYGERKDGSFFKDGGTVEQVAHGVGGMLPSVVLSIWTGPVGGMLASGVSAAGNAAESAYKDGAGFVGGMTYGNVVGGIEMATEKFVGGGLEKAFGSGWLDDIIPIGDWAKTGIGRYVANAAGEGVEEAVSELADPVAKTIYKGKDSFSDYTDAEYRKGVVQAAITGAAISGIYGGAFDAMAGGVKVGDVDSLLNDANAITRKAKNLDADNRLDDATEKTLKSQTLGDLQAVEKILKSASEAKRAEIIESRGLGKMFDADGSIKGKFLKAFESSDTELNKKFYSYSERGYENAIKGDLVKLNGELEVRFGEKATKVGVYNGELTDKGNTSYVKLKKALNALNKISGKDIGLIITDASDLFNGKLVDDKRIYITADTLENGTWAGTLVHEYTHFEEGTKEYNELVKLLESDADFSESISKVVLNKKAYGFDTEAIKEIRTKVESGAEVSQAERWAYEEYRSELEAHMSEAVLGTESFIDKVIRTDASLAEKILGKIGELKAAFERIGDPEAQAQHKRLAEAERLYLKAAEAAGYKYQGGKMVSVDEDDEEKENTVTSMNEENMQVSGGKYSYNSLIKKDDMVIETFDVASVEETSRYRDDTVAFGKEMRDIATKKNNSKNTAQSTYLYCGDLDSDVLISRNSFKHSGARLDKEYVTICKNIDRVLENAIVVNELNARDNATNGAYVLLCVVEIEQKHIIVRCVINKRTHHLEEFQQLDAIRKQAMKKGDVSLRLPDYLFSKVEKGSVTSPKISISNLIDFVKTQNLANEVFSKDVCQNLEIKRSSGSLSSNLRYSFKENSDNNKNTASNNEKGQADNKKPNSYTKATNEKLSAKEQKLVERLDKAEEKAKEEHQKRKDAESYNKTANRVLKLVRDINNWKKGVFESAADANGDVFKSIIGELTRVDFKGNVSTLATRKAMKKLADWYGAADVYPIVQELKAADLWSEDALSAMVAIGDANAIESQKPLSVAELQNVEMVIRHLKHITEIYHRVFRAGKYIDAKPLAEEYIRIIGENAKINVGRVAKLIDGKYYEYFGDAESLMKWHDRYNKGGFLTATFNELREGALNMAIAQMEMRAELDDWLDKNPNFLKRLNNTTIEVEGIEMSRAEALSLYMTARREQAEGGLAVGGFEVKDAKSGEKIGVDGLVDKELAFGEKRVSIDISDIETLRKIGRKSINQLTDEEKNATKKWADKFYDELGVKSPFFRAEFGDWRAHDKAKVKTTAVSDISVNDALTKMPTGSFSNRDTGWTISAGSLGKGDTYSHSGREKISVKMLSEIKSIIESAVLLDTEVSIKDSSKKHSETLFMHKLYAPVVFKGQKYIAKITVEEYGVQNGGKRFYNLRGIEIDPAGDAPVVETTYGTVPDAGSINSVSDLFAFVKQNDKNFNPKPIKNNSLNEDGTPKIVKDNNATYDMEKMIGLVGEFKDSLFEQFSENEKKYLDFVEKILNEDCKARKERTDNIRLGYSNTLEGFYYPIRRGHIAYKVGEDTLGAELGRIKSLSFNKDTVKGSKGRLFIEPINNVVDRHIAGIAMYENLSIAIDNFNRLFNMDISGNKNNPVTIAKAMEKEGGWAEAGKYIDKLIKDIEGIKSTDKWESKALGFIRSGFVKFQLGANPKTWVTQLSSLFASMSVLDPQYVGKAMVARVDGAELDKYSALAKLRNTENTAALSQGVVDKLGRVGDVLMKPIGKTDRFVIKKLWHACQLQVEAEQKLKLGSADNKAAAAKMLEKVIFETQQNSLLTERSAAMRSSSELMKGFTMFSADAMKLTARIVDAYGRVCVIKEKLKGAEGDVKKSLEAELKEATGEFKRASGSAVSTAVFMSLIALAFSHLYGKKDEDETFAEAATTFGFDFVGNLLGGLPLIRDVYSYMVDGYELNHYALSSVNDLVAGVNGLFSLTKSWVTGKQITQQEVASKTKAALFGLGQLFGIPLRNAYNVGRGLAGGVSLITGNGKSFGYAWDSFFYDKSYKNDLNKAIEAGDDKLVARISALMVDESFDGVGKPVADELRRLVAVGADVLPRAVGDSITYDGEEYAFTLRQRKRFDDIYGTADEVLTDLVKLKQYKQADDDVKAKAIKFLYETYYQLAIDDMLGLDSSEKNVLFAEAIDIEKLAIIVAQARTFTADKDKSGKAINGTKKIKVTQYIESLSLTAAEKYMIYGYLGYRNTRGEDKVKAYINRLKLTSAEKKALLEFSGYKAA